MGGFALPVRDPEARRVAVSALALAAALLMLASTFTTVVSVDVASGSCEALNDTDPALADKCTQTGLDRHSVVFPLLALAILAMGWGAARGGSRPAAAALAAFGALALGIVLLSDVPASNETGVIGRDFAGAEARAGAGLWLEAAGGALALAAGVLAVLPAAAQQRDRRTAAG